MRLRRIELAGFKSFVDPTRIEIGEGITSIVGPNGCGKSNVVDAIRWVLGEHSAKHLRGGVMDDLVFQGSESRAPVGLCDVELTFAVERGQLPAPYHELDEVRIRRRLHREGGSDAYINGKAVRLRDVVDLFLDTGISTRAYAIVEQGAIARMITSKPEERRLMLEEAAGVMKYRSRRREAERKMENTRQNLERATDLLDEVKSQCRSLRQQASRAERFKALQEEYRQARALGLGVRYRRLRERCERVESELREAQNREAEASRAQAAAEKALVEGRERLVAHESEVQKLQDRLRAAEQRRGELQQRAERLAGERRLLAERRTTLAERIAEAERRTEELDGEVAERRERMRKQDDAGLRERLERTRNRLEEARAAFDVSRRRRDELLADYERLKNERENVEKRRRQAEESLARLAERRELLEGQLSELEGQLAATGKRREETAVEAAAAERACGEAEARLEEGQRRLEARREARDTAAARLSEHESAVRRLAGEIEELRARTENREVPGELRQALRERGGVWVDEALEVPEGLEQAVAAALRGQAADVRIPANPDLSAWGESLDQARRAPVALFADGVAPIRPAGESLALAIGLETDHPLYSLFAGVALVDDIRAAGPGGDGCVVSRDGWRLEPDGWLVPPAGKRTADRLALTRELRRREESLAREQEALANAGEAFEAAEAALTDQQQEWRAAHVALTEMQGERQTGTSRLRRLDEELESLRARGERLRGDLEEVGREQTQWSEQLDGMEAGDAEREEAAAQALEDQTVRQEECERQLHRAQDEVAAAERELALHAQAREAAAGEITRLERERESLMQRREEDGRRLAETERQIEGAAGQKSLDRELREAAEAVETLHREFSDLRQGGHALQQRAAEAERHEREARGHHQKEAGQCQQLEVRIAQERTRLQDLGEEVTQRCGVRIEELLGQMEEVGEELDEERALGRAQELEERLNRFGPVNLLAIEEFEQASERETFLTGQVEDLESSLATLTETIARINRTTKQRFAEVFEKTNAIFRKTFPRLFGGGRAELRLDSDDLLSAGVEVISQPPGKRLQDVSLLSGGEKALTAVALVFSIFQIKPAPFCILDEVDAPLDDANVGRFGEMIRELSGEVQFLAITHNKITMQLADRLIGVSMPEPGVSRIVSVDVEQMEREMETA